jgi:hypothetical protein
MILIQIVLFLTQFQRLVGTTSSDIFDRILQIQGSLFGFSIAQPQTQLEAQIVSSSQPTNLQIPPLINQSYETLIEQLYSIPVEPPHFLIINGIRSNLISFEETARMLQTDLIDRYILDPLLQPWAGPPGTSNRVITLFGKNGITYLAKVKYDQQTNQVFPPI